MFKGSTLGFFKQLRIKWKSSQFEHHNLKKENEIRCCIDRSVSLHRIGELLLATIVFFSTRLQAENY